MKLNTTKSVVLKAGSLKSKNIKYVKNINFIWTCEYAKTLGITFHTDMKQIHKLNLEPKVNDFNNCLKQWKHRKLSLMGKVTIVKTFALPKLVYPFAVLPNPTEAVMKDINKAIFRFICDNKPE